jgi:8-oxo-dGTP pyrophosphatase MutT (NUDIX family)
MKYPVRNSVRVLLLNAKNELLLICAKDPRTTSIDGKYHGRFWYTIGGGIKPMESIQEAAFREVYEETGIEQVDVELGPIVWFGEFDLVLDGTKQHLKQQFIVAKTTQHRVSFSNLEIDEKASFLKLAWFSLDALRTCNEIIYPVHLPQHLPDILLGKYPNEPMKIDLAAQPDRSSFKLR